jgi:hypothetical protein
LHSSVTCLHFSSVHRVIIRATILTFTLQFLLHVPGGLGGLLETTLSPLDRKLALSPLDDELVTPQDLAAIQAGVTSLERGPGVPMESVVTANSTSPLVPR